MIKVSVTEYRRGEEPRQYADAVLETSPLGVMFECGAETVTITKASSITSYSRNSVTPE